MDIGMDIEKEFTIAIIRGIEYNACIRDLWL